MKKLQEEEEVKDWNIYKYIKCLVCLVCLKISFHLECANTNGGLCHG